MRTLLDKNSKAVLKRIEAHTFQDEDGDEYEGSTFGGFGDYFRRKKIKLQNLDAELRSSAGDKPPIFRGIVAHVNGYTQPSLNDLHRLIVTHGGGFMQYLDGKTTVTHIIAANLTPKKAVEFRRYRLVKPAWIVDSVNAGKLLPWDEYRVISEAPGQRLLGFSQGKMVSQVNVDRSGYRDQMETSWYSTKVKGIADDIDEKATSGTADQEGNFDGQPIEAITEAVSEDADGSVQLSGSFEVTSSLEEALKQAARASQHRGVNLMLDIEDQVSRPAASPSLGGNECGPMPLDGTTSSKAGALQIPQKHPPDMGSPSPSKKAKQMTAEEHNAKLLLDPHIRKSSTANPNFLQQFYSESRLHHLSTWKAELKSRLQQMAAEAAASQKPAKRKSGQRSYILHVDFDCFFCAVSLKNSPDYIDKPAVVAHGSGTGSEIASCNYPARAFGVKNGMWMKQALTLCPTIKVLPYDFPAYEEASKSFYEAILGLGCIVQSVSVDEALVDITALCLPDRESDDNDQGITTEQEKANGIALGLRRHIKQTTGCEVSIGIGANILLAKVALRKAKPAGQHQITPENVLDIVGELSVQSLPGVAYSIGSKLEEIGVKLVKDIRLLTKERLTTVLGPKTGEKIWDYSRGIDKSELGEQAVRKSVSAEVSWGIRFISQAEAEDFVQNLCVELQRRLMEQKVKGKQLTIKIMKKAADAPLNPPKHLGHGKCDTYTKSTALLLATNSTQFVLPTQIDPAVLAELPHDIRSKLMAQSRSRSASRTSSPGILSRSASPTSISRRGLTLQQNEPLPLQFDPEVFEALPEDMKAEVLASYSAQGSGRQQAILPQSPRKNKTRPPKKLTPTKKRGRPVGSKNKKEDPFPTLTQSNFVLGKSADTSVDSEGPELLDLDFLAALPEEMRLEILAENRQKRLAKRGGLAASNLKKRRPPEPAEPGQIKLILPRRDPRPTFTTRGLWKGDELRGTVQMWHTEFRDDGPLSEDVQALERYLRRVVTDERNLSKARGVIKWLTWLVDEDESTDNGQKVWLTALETIKGSVQVAVQERGLGILDL
ncbi:hypothetical protein OIDMADRAFT_156819 [Oidiodendron maius Zn]|uniref:DNA repair protein REV1 n=1 Tax=Oidiodendron maius (strain Zn) TaxID=913774 RepID=A0A0C3HQZ1_OIDMZ|nr:hypothetical protein OIDMADRAFT_156819 [Oidiodendron maius Zn]